MAFALTACGGGNDGGGAGGEGQEPEVQKDPLEEARKVMADAKTMQSLFAKLAETVEGGESLTYDRMVITMTVSNLNNAADFTVSEEAKNA